jgi:hypothetical protein
MRRRLLDGDEALPLQAFEYGERRRQQFTALAVVPTPACDRRLDGDDQELGRHRFHCHGSLSRPAAAHPIAFASSILADRLSTKAEAEGGKSVTWPAKPSPTS